jgi:NADH-quinone oxidoreductase subunit L
MLLLIVLLPFAGFLVNAFVGRRLPKRVSGGVACAAMLGAFAVSAASIWTMMGAPNHAIEQQVFMWLPSDDLQVPFALRLDPLAALMILVVSGIGSLIHIYSTGYMHEETDPEYARYFSYLNLFASFMLVLVLGANFPVMFIGWEGVGLCSYLLIGFWFKKRSASDAGKKAFIVNRIGDFGFILGMLLIFVTFGTLDFQGVAEGASERAPEVGTWGAMTIATLLLFIGATGKSAQIPLYVWLPDAMEGPTPVSALIHAATMVTAGVYMIGRNAVLFSHAPDTLAIVAAVGVATALMAGTIGLVQNDIKRVLAYSTVSQLGLMFLAMGVGAYAAGIFHLYTHAFFKALLFLGSGAVIHALAGEQDLRNMGGLKPYLPITYWTFVIGALAIAGFPFLSGFFSKDEILYLTFASDHGAARLLWGVGALTSLLTAIYMFRLVILAFHGERRMTAPVPAHPEEEEPAAHFTDTPAKVPPGGAHLTTPPDRAHQPEGKSSAHVAHGTSHVAHGTSHVAHGTSHVAPASAKATAGKRDAAHGHHDSHAPHDAPWSMAIPLIILAIGSVLAGYVGIPYALGGHNWLHGFLEPSFQVVGAPHYEAVHTADEIRLERILMAISVGIALAGIGLAYFFWGQRRDLVDNLARQFRGVHQLLLNKYYVDELYDATIVQPIKGISTGALWRGVDVGVIDGTVNGVGRSISAASGSLRRLQTGSVRTYAASLFLGVVLIVGYYIFR